MHCTKCGGQISSSEIAYDDNKHWTCLSYDRKYAIESARKKKTLEIQKRQSKKKE